MNIFEDKTLLIRFQFFLVFYSFLPNSWICLLMIVYLTIGIKYYVSAFFNTKFNCLEQVKDEIGVTLE